MAEIGAYEAKTHLPQLLERVQKGERFIITRHGRPVAELVPVSGRDESAIRETLALMRKRRQALEQAGVRLRDALQPDESLRDLAHAGHRR